MITAPVPPLVPAVFVVLVTAILLRQVSIMNMNVMQVFTDGSAPR